LHEILAVTTTEDVRVVAYATNERVIARSADQCVVAFTA
jgi:hypothetical protein